MIGKSIRGAIATRKTATGAHHHIDEQYPLIAVGRLILRRVAPLVAVVQAADSRQGDNPCGVRRPLQPEFRHDRDVAPWEPRSAVAPACTRKPRHGPMWAAVALIQTLWLAITRSWVISTSVSRLHPDRIGRFRRGHNLLISLTDEFWRGTGKPPLETPEKGKRVKDPKGNA